MAQLVKNPSAMREIRVQSPGWEDPLEKRKGTHSSILAWRIQWGHKESDTTEQLSLFCFTRCIFNYVALRGSHLYARGLVIQLPSFHRPKALTPAPPLHPTHLSISLAIRAPPLKQLVTLLLASAMDFPACCQDPGFPVLSDKFIHPF